MEDNFLLCDEVLFEEEEQEEVLQENGGGDDDDDDDDDPEMNYVRLLIGTESDSPGLNDQEVTEMINDNWIQEIRRHAIEYILGTGQGFGFSHQTVYKSVICVDRYLAVRLIEVGGYWKVRLLALTCLSLSAKMDETSGNVPPLSQYPVIDYEINVNDIRRMELLVLDDLNWNMSYVTPFNFTEFFVSRFCRQISTREATRRRTGEIIMSVLRDLRLMNHRRSVIAAAATLLAVSNNLTTEQLEIEINTLPLNGLLQIDNVWYCYDRCRQLNNRHI
ncbi:unnamed protein product [Withania somnifera]